MYRFLLRVLIVQVSPDSHQIEIALSVIVYYHCYSYSNTNVEAYLVTPPKNPVVDWIPGNPLTLSPKGLQKVKSAKHAVGFVSEFGFDFLNTLFQKGSSHS